MISRLDYRHKYNCTSKCNRARSIATVFSLSELRRAQIHPRNYKSSSRLIYIFLVYSAAAAPANNKLAEGSPLYFCNNSPITILSSTLIKSRREPARKAGPINHRMSAISNFR